MFWDRKRIAWATLQMKSASGRSARILTVSGIRIICCFRFVFMVADSCIVRASIALLLRIPDLPGRLVDGEHEPHDSFALGAGDEVVFESARFIRRHVAEQVRLRPFWIDRAVLLNW